MKTKKLLALVLALVMALSCMSLTALAATQKCLTCKGTGEIACTMGCEGKSLCPPCGGTGIMYCPTCKGTKTVEVFSKDITVTIPEITVGTVTADIKKGVAFADSEIANDIEVFDVILRSPSDGKYLEQVTAPGMYGCGVVLKIKDTTAYTSFELDNFDYTGTVTVSGINEMNIAHVNLAAAFDLDNHTVIINADGPDIYLTVGGYVVVEGNNEKAVNYTLVTDTIAPVTDYCDTKVATITGCTGFTGEGTIVYEAPEVVKTATTEAIAYDDTIYAAFGNSDDPYGVYVATNPKTQTGWYFVRLHATMGENETLQECWTYIPIFVGSILDLEEGNEYSDSTTIDQLYDVSVTEKRTDVTKVQVSWKLDNIQASVSSNKIWDTENLKWVEDTNKENGATADPVTAEFNFVNLSSVAMDAQVTFAPEKDFDPTIAFTDNGVTENADGIITLDSKAYGKNIKNEGKISVTVTPNDDDFATLTEDATDVKYGTYTVTITRAYIGKATFTDSTTMSWEKLKAKYNTEWHTALTDTSIGDDVFADNEEIKSITIPAGVTTIGDRAFRNCTSLKEITIPVGVESIGSDAFDGCTSLEEITIPVTVTAIGNSAFEGCTSLKEITIPVGITAIGKSTFADCTSLEEITIPAGVTEIGRNAFEKCTSLKEITIPAGVTTIGREAFDGCTSLEKITIPADVTEIGKNAFEGCSNLTIDCSAFKEQPEGWNSNWNPGGCSVIWGTN